MRKTSFAILTLILASLLGLDAYRSCAEPVGVKASSQQRNIARIVAALLPRRHVSRQPVDDNLSRRALNQFIKSIDPGKLYFLQSDIDEFAKYETSIDDLTKQGSLEPAFEIYNRFLQRLDERTAVINELLDQPFDFSLDESLVVDADDASYAKNATESRDRWRKELKYRLLVLKAEAKEQEARGESLIPEDPADQSLSQEPAEQLRRRYVRIQTRLKRLDSDKLLERYLTAITSSYDPHSTYMSPSTLEQFSIIMRLNLEGIGAELREDGDYTKITKIIDGGAASRDTVIAKGDRLLAVGQGDDGEWVDVVGESVDNVASIVRGRSGTKVRLKLRSKTGELKETSMIRSRVDLKDNAAVGHLISYTTVDNESVKIGYVMLPGFYRDSSAPRQNPNEVRSSTRDVRRLLDGFRRDQADAVILDLRTNGGGFLDEAVNVAGLFIDRGPVVQVQNFNGAVEVLSDEQQGQAWSGPLVVLTSKFSASASEIVAGTMKEYGRGVIVGDPTTHGKGTVQSPLDLAAEVLGRNRNVPSLGALKVTVQKYYLPDGDSTQVGGVAADVVLPTLTGVLATGEGELDYALPNDKIPATRHQRYGLVTPSIVKDLQVASRGRIAKSTEFAELLRRLDAIRDRKELKAVSLNETKFEASRKATQSTDEMELDPDELAATKFPDGEEDNEVLEIVQDYVSKLATRG